MVRSLWIGPVLMVLAVTGLAWSQVVPPGSTPAAPKEHTMTVQETDKAPLKCKILKMWHEHDGGRALQVQALATGEMLTIIQAGPASVAAGKAVAMKIVHWGDASSPPAGTPIAPIDATILGTANAKVVVTERFPPKTETDMSRHSLPNQQWPSAFAPEDSKPAKGTATTIVGKRPAAESQPTPSDKPWPAAYAPEVTGDKMVALPIQMNGMEAKKTDGAAGAQAPVVSTGPKSRITEIVRDESKTQVPGGITYVPSTHDAGTGQGKMETVIVQAPPREVNPVVEGANPVTPNGAEPGPAIEQTPAKTNEWQKSWTRVEPLPPEALRKPEVPLPVEAPRIVVKADVKKPEVTVKADLPHADAKKPDPLQQPDRFTKLPVPADAKTTAQVKAPTDGNTATKPVQQVKSATDAADATKPPVALPDLTKNDRGSGAVKIPVTAQPDAVKTGQSAAAIQPPFTPGAKPADVAKPYVPPGMGSIAAAQIAEQPETRPAAKPAPTGKGQANAYDSGNAFSPPQPWPTTPKPPSNPTVAQSNFAQGYPAAQPQFPQPPLPGPQPGPQLTMDRGVPSGMGNAFTSAGTARPMPPDMGAPNHNGNAFAQPSPNMDPQMAMTDPRLQPTQLQVAANPVPTKTNVPQLLAVLRDSLYPSQREWAADSLASQRSSQSNQQVVSALISAAKEDPAPTVRAGCVRAIGQLQINTAAAVTVVQALKTDPDPRVRREAEQALPVLTSSQPHALDTSIRPVSSH